MNSYKIVDTQNWDRKQHCDIFKNSASPQYCVNFDLDITGFYKAVKANKWSFTLAMIYIVTNVASEIENYRYRFLGDEIVIYNKIDTFFTWLNKETELYKMVFVPMQNSIEEFIKVAKETAENQQEYFVSPPPNSVYTFSPMPWVTFTHKSHTYGGNPKNAVPIFDWGKFYKRDGRVIMPFSAQVHHSFVDGIHIGKLCENLQKYLNSFENE